MPETYQTNLLNVASCYITNLKVPLTLTSLQQSLNENPFYPSLFSLSNTLERFHIPHEALAIEKESFEELTPPFIAYLKNQLTGTDFVLVTAITDDEVSYIAENKKIKIIDKKKFLDDWEKIVLKAEANDKSGEKDYKLKRRKEIICKNKNIALISFAALLFLSTVYLFIHSLPSIFVTSAATILFVKILGLSISVLLVFYEIDKSNVFVRSICTAGKQTNCDVVLQSKASKIIGMSWCEVGFFYFASTFFFILFPSVSFANKIAVLFITNCLSAPYILFSLYYQWKIVKQWCPLCLIVQGILLMELIWSIENFSLPPLPIASLHMNSYRDALLPIACCLLFPMVLLYVTKPLLLKAKNEPVYKAAYKRLLYNPHTFNNLLQQQPTAPDGYQNIGIAVGNPNAATTIIKVCNPYCGPCANVHPILDEIIQNNKNVKLRLIFTASNNATDKRGIVVKHLLAINEKQNNLQMEQALDDWYLAEKKDYNAFAAKYLLNTELKQQEEKIEEMSKWCKEANITHTPTLFINGHRLPETYSLNELKQIL